MAQYYDYGIDLGTTNSCIAKLESTGVRVFQNLDNMNVTPSAVYIGKNSRMLIGRRAYDKVISEPENAAVEFKRLMGVKTCKHFETAQKDLTPVEMSAEVLKSLREDVFRQTNSYLYHAIITVPAAFGTIQCEDTQKAAELAGFTSVVLLQEPIAAGIAYGAKDDTKDQYWMVFDFGGGTLDIAIISTYNGRLTVINHEGDNYLGGKNIDEAIYKEIILPVIESKFSLPSDAAKMEFIHRKLLMVAEDAKKTLSTSSNAVMDIFDIGEDENGEAIECRIEFNINQFEKLIKPIIKKCFALCDKAISESKISKESISKILLVGGTTLIPAIRSALKNNYSIPLDTSIDPMTVVASGAAIFGSTHKVPDNEQKKNTDESQVSVNIEYTPATSENTANIVGRFSSDDESLQYSQVKVDNISGIWTSGWIDVLEENQGIFDVDVVLQENTINGFKISVREKNGVILSVSNPEFQIKHQDNILITSAPPIPHSLCIEINSDGQRKLEKMIIKGTTLPAKTVRSFKANKTIKPNTDDFIAIKVWEGENVENPDDNQWVGNIYIRSEGINRPIPEGFDIEVGINIDESRKISVNAYVPHLDLEIKDDLVYNSEQLDLQKPMQLLENDIRVLYNRIDEIINDAVLNDIIEKAENYASELHEIDLEYMECNKLIGLDDDRVVQLLKKFNTLKTKIAELEYLQKESNKESTELDEIQNMQEAIEKFGDEDDKQEFKDLSETYKKIDSNARSRGKEHYKEKMSELQAKVMLNNPDVLKYLLIDLCNPAKVYHDARQANHWKQKGIQAIQNEDMSGMKEALRNLMKLSGQDTFSTLSERELPPDLR